MIGNKLFKILCICILVIFTTHSQSITEVDFILDSSYTGGYLWGNFIGISMEYSNILNFTNNTVVNGSILNNTLFQGYQLNSNLKGDWNNNFVASIKLPLGIKYNCTGLQINQTNGSVVCNHDLINDTTYWSVLGEYVWNTMNQPYWCVGLDIQGVNLTVKNHQTIFNAYMNKIFSATHRALFCSQIVDYGDQMVSRGYKTSYTPTNFLTDLTNANNVAFGVGYSGPGITENATSDWLAALIPFTTINYYGHFTVRCIVFRDKSTITIQKILSDNSTKYYLKNRFMVNSSYGFSSFAQYSLGINDIKLTQDPGVDGITNTFASAIWAVDIIIEFAIMQGWEIDFNHRIQSGNFQALLGPAPNFKPTPMFYGLIFATLIRDGSPQVIVPSQSAHTSSKIKAFGFSNGEIYKILLLNKDTNTSLNGLVYVKSQLTSDLTCVTLEAPSLSSTDGVTIAGYQFVGGNATVNGAYKNFEVPYSYDVQGYPIPIKYAQAVLCSTDDTKYTWPTGYRENFENHFASLAALFILISLILAF